MAETMEDGTEHISDQIHSHARDLLRRFTGGSVWDSSQPAAMEKDTGNIELRLGLSLGGFFGVDSKDKVLVRSSSAASFSFSEEQEQVVASAAHGLARTCSLPVVTGEEHQKRREMQSLRRMEAKRKRLEKKGSGPRSMPKPMEIPTKVVDRGCGGTVLPSSREEGVNAAEVELRGSRGLRVGVWFEGQKGHTTPSLCRLNNCHRQQERAPSIDNSSLTVGKDRATGVESTSSGVTTFDVQQIQVP